MLRLFFGTRNYCSEFFLGTSLGTRCADGEHGAGCGSYHVPGCRPTQSPRESSGLTNAKHDQVNFMLCGGFENAFGKVAELNQHFRFGFQARVGGHKFAQSALVAVDQILWSA